MPLLISFAGALLLSSGFALAEYGRPLFERSGFRWKALSAGVAVAYVFIHVIPELHQHHQKMLESTMGKFFGSEKLTYFWALAGFVLFTGLGTVGLRLATDKPVVGHGTVQFRFQMAGFAVYMLLIGYLLVVREETSYLSLGLYVFTMALHVFMLDLHFSERFLNLYPTQGRVLLASSVISGSLLGTVEALPDVVTSGLFAFVVGGVVIMSANEEFRAGTGIQFAWFAGGACFYGVLLLLI